MPRSLWENTRRATGCVPTNAAIRAGGSACIAASDRPTASPVVSAHAARDVRGCCSSGVPGSLR